ncbi:hypothetical protein [Nannocystis bainbridge]|uniref:Uncharacterized protein n=1 Tax=Nannocystis bainbridge TaxID=2995303 RepID=A0ABT5EDJ1_9BACT|nr:hypothetical protein [Nannocystis bainbridge]MDC0723470.1 hypothetical protein [Nannocystis bainbridge]
MSDPLRIPVRAPNGLLWVNVFLQPAVMLLCLWLAMTATTDSARTLMWQLVALSTAGFVGAAWLLARRRRSEHAIVIDDRALTIPGVLGGATEVVLASIESARLEVTRSATETLSVLRLEAKNRPPVLVSSRLVGAQAVQATADSLRARGVPVA